QPAGPDPDDAAGGVRGAARQPGGGDRAEPDLAGGVAGAAGGLARPPDPIMTDDDAQQRAPGLVADILARRGEFTLALRFALAPGATAAVLGPNGAGKSTLVAALAGLVALERAEVHLHGRALGPLPPQERGLGVMFQGYCLFEH